MPNIEMIVCEGFDDARKARLLANLTSATAAALDAPVESVRIWLSELDPRNVAVGGIVCADDTQPAARAGAIFQAFLIAGRTDTQKSRLIDALTASAASDLAIDRARVRVIIKDVPNTDFGIGGQTAASLGRGVGRAHRPPPSQA